MQTSVLFFIRSHSSVLGALAFVAVASASSGCSTEPCPDGTKQDGDVCRRLPAMMRSANQGAGSGAMRDDEDLTDEDLDNPGAGRGGAGGKMSTGAAGKGGAGGSAVDGDDDEAAGKGGSGGKGGAGGSGGSKAGAGGGGAGGVKAVTGGMGAAGKGGASGAAAGKGGSGAGAGGKDAAAGGGAGKEATAGMGAGGMGAAGKGEAGAKATEIPASLIADTWFCVPLEGGCVCVDGRGEASDTCGSQRPKCCYVLTNEDAPNCQCHDEDSEQCEREGGSEDAIKVATCPPPGK